MDCRVGYKMEGSMQYPLSLELTSSQEVRALLVEAGIDNVSVETQGRKLVLVATDDDLLVHASEAIREAQAVV